MVESVAVCQFGVCAVSVKTTLSSWTDVCRLSQVDPSSSPPQHHCVWEFDLRTVEFLELLTSFGFNTLRQECRFVLNLIKIHK